MKPGPGVCAVESIPMGDKKVRLGTNDVEEFLRFVMTRVD